MKQLINKNYGPGSAKTPASIRYAPYGSSANRGSFGYTDQRADPETSGLDDDRAPRRAGMRPLAAVDLGNAAGSIA